MGKKRTKVSRIYSAKKIDVDQFLFKDRNIFIYDYIDKEISATIVKQLLVLNKLNQKPIGLWINSGGGSVSDGLAIIDTIQKIKAPVITVINGRACSMAGIISVAGRKRLMTKHSIWMAHDMASGDDDYVTKMLDHAEFLKDYQKKLFIFLAEHTKLSKTELEKARNGELWLFAEDCIKKGIVDEII